MWPSRRLAADPKRHGLFAQSCWARPHSDISPRAASTPVCSRKTAAAGSTNGRSSGIRTGAGELSRTRRVLRPRELQVLRLMDQGKQTKEIDEVIELEEDKKLLVVRAVIRRSQTVHIEELEGPNA